MKEYTFKVDFTADINVAAENENAAEDILEDKIIEAYGGHNEKLVCTGFKLVPNSPLKKSKRN